MRRIPRRYLIIFSYPFSRLAVIFLKGNKVECPVCNCSFRKFLPYGIKGRDNVLCPNCLSLERHRLLWIYLNEKTPFFTSKLKMLHIAPEQCFLSRFRKMDNLEYTTADLESPLADIKLNVMDMPLPNDTYDVVMCNHVMEHVDDDHKAMTEILRVLKHGGFAILQVPLDNSLNITYENPEITNPWEREKHFLQKDHVRLYGKDYGKRLEKAGFAVSEDDFIQHVGEQLISRYRLPKNEIIYFCRKA